MTDPKLAFKVRGKGRLYPHPTARPGVLSVTNALGCLDKSAPLMWWAAGLTVEAIADDLANFQADLNAEGKEATVKKWKGLWRKNRDDAADAGTSIHDYLEQRFAGTPHDEAADGLHADAVKYLASARTFADGQDGHWRGAAEQTVVGVNYAGTADLIGWLKDTDGPLVIDYKTRAKHAVYESDVLQLAALRGCTHVASGTRDEPQFDRMVEPAGARLVTITEKSAKVHDLTDRTGDDALRVFLALRDVREWLIGGVQ